MGNDDLPEGWSYSSGRMELYCPHGLGHPVPRSRKQAHGCDGYCGGSPGEEDSEWVQAVEAVRGE